MIRQSQPLTNEKFMDGLSISMSIGRALRAIGYQTFMRWMDSVCNETFEWNFAAETSK